MAALDYFENPKVPSKQKIKSCFRPGCHYFPIFLSIILALNIAICLVLSIFNGHFMGTHPFISELGKEFPERAIFAQLLNIASCLAAICVVLYYKLARNYYDKHDDYVCSTKHFNITAISVGLISCVCLSISANFPVNSKVEIVHYVASTIGYFCALLYSIFSTLLALKYKPFLGSQVVCYLRIITTSVLFVAEITFGVTLTFIKFKSYNATWMPIICATAEWIASACVCVMFLTMAPVFVRINTKHGIYLKG